jgi:hypothetical protein
VSTVDIRQNTRIPTSPRIESRHGKEETPTPPHACHPCLPRLRQPLRVVVGASQAQLCALSTPPLDASVIVQQGVRCGIPWYTHHETSQPCQLFAAYAQQTVNSIVPPRRGGGGGEGVAAFDYLLFAHPLFRPQFSCPNRSPARLVRPLCVPPSVGLWLSPYAKSIIMHGSLLFPFPRLPLLRQPLPLSTSLTLGLVPVSCPKEEGQEQGQEQEQELAARHEGIFCMTTQASAPRRHARELGIIPSILTLPV